MNETTSTQITTDNLKNSGYHVVEASWFSHHEGYINSFQKRFDDKYGSRYFITLHAFTKELQGRTYEIFKIDCQFQTLECVHVDVNMLIEAETTLEYLENFYQSLWENGNFRYHATNAKS